MSVKASEWLNDALMSQEYVTKKWPQKLNRFGNGRDLSNERSNYFCQKCTTNKRMTCLCGTVIILIFGKYKKIKYLCLLRKTGFNLNLLSTMTIDPVARYECRKCLWQFKSHFLLQFRWKIIPFMIKFNTTLNITNHQTTVQNWSTSWLSAPALVTTLGQMRVKIVAKILI